MENYIRKILQGFIRFQYSDSLTKQIHHWLIGKENADLKEQALKEIWDTTEAKADLQTELSFSHVLQGHSVNSIKSTN